MFGWHTGVFPEIQRNFTDWSRDCQETWYREIPIPAIGSMDMLGVNGRVALLLVRSGWQAVKLVKWPLLWGKSEIWHCSSWRRESSRGFYYFYKYFTGGWREYRDKLFSVVLSNRMGNEIGEIWLMFYCEVFRHWKRFSREYVKSSLFKILKNWLSTDLSNLVQELCWGL